jgi:ribose-phosphate pyrophosphokinase
MITLNGEPIVPTIFPDKTSQVWKLPEEQLDRFSSSIVWKFEHEGEFMHLAQLATLLRSRRQCVELHLPYLPYARQDKEVDNSQTFALQSFVQLLNVLPLDRVVLYDPHNVQPLLRQLNVLIKVVTFEKEASDAAWECEAGLWCFPDWGAEARYGATLEPSVTASKTRDPVTGTITSADVSSNVAGKRVMIVDDLCDGGATFIGLAKLLRAKGASDVFLFVSHGIFSKGLAPLFDAGISRIFTPEGEKTL